MQKGVFWMCVTALSCGFTFGKQAAGDLFRFQYSAPLRLPATAQEELADLVLTPQVYAVTRDDLADVGIVHGESGSPVPCLVECVTEERCELTRVNVPLRLVRAEERDGGRLRITLVRDDSSQSAFPLRGVVIHTPLRDFERTLTVEVSEDGSEWQTVAQEARILDLTSYADFRVEEVGLPAVTQRHIRLTVNQMIERRQGSSTTVKTSADAKGAVQHTERAFFEEQKPFRVDRVDGWVEHERWVRDARPLTTREYRFLSAEPEALRNQFPTARLIGFEAGRAPLSKVVLKSDVRVLNLSFQLFEKGDAAQEAQSGWRQIAKGVVTRTAFRAYLEERLGLSFNVSRASCYCLVFTDRSGAADISIAECLGPDYHIIFPFSTDQSYRLLAGNPDATQLEGYEPEQIRGLIRQGFKPVRAHLAGWLENPSWQRNRRGIFSFGTRWLLSVSVVFAISVLGLSVAWALRHIPLQPE
jgi:hypothetical protein